MNALSRGRRTWIAVILALAVVTGLGAMVATWVRRQALDTNNWTHTSARLLQDQKVRTAVGDYLVNQLFTQVNVEQQLKSALPSQLQSLAGPVSGGLRQVATQAAPELLARPRVQDAWETANRAAHKSLIKIINGGGKNISTTNGEVVLNLNHLVNELASSIGIGAQVTLPSSVGNLVVMRSSQLKTAQDVAKAVKGLSILLTIVSFGLFALAVWLGRGARRIVVRRVGWSFIAMGLLALLVRRVGGNNVANGLTQVDSVRGAIHDTWFIGTSLLYNLAIAFIVYGILIVAYAWLAGDTKWALGARRRLAPVFRERMGLVYGVVGGIFLVVLAWGPTPAFRIWWAVLLIAGLVVLAVETLKRQEAREFPGPLSELPTPKKPALVGHD